ELHLVFLIERSPNRRAQGAGRCDESQRAGGSPLLERETGGSLKGPRDAAPMPQSSKNPQGLAISFVRSAGITFGAIETGQIRQGPADAPHVPCSAKPR